MGVYAGLTGIHDCVVLWVAYLTRGSDNLTDSCLFLHVQTTDNQDNDEHDKTDHCKGYADNCSNSPVEIDKNTKSYQL